MTYPDTSIAHPTDIVREADAPWHTGDVFSLRGLVDAAVLIRPLSRHVYASRWSHDGRATAIVADIAVLEDHNHAASLYSQVTIFQPNVVKALCAVLDNPQVFTVAGVVSTIGDSERRALVLAPLPEALVPFAAAEAAARDWDYPRTTTQSWAARSPLCAAIKDFPGRPSGRIGCHAVGRIRH